MCKSYGIGTVKVCTDTGNTTDVQVQVVHERSLDFDLLLGYDAIKALGGVLIIHTDGNGKILWGGPCVCSIQDWPTWL